MYIGSRRYTSHVLLQIESKDFTGQTVANGKYHFCHLRCDRNYESNLVLFGTRWDLSDSFISMRYKSQDWSKYAYTVW